MLKKTIRYSLSVVAFVALLFVVSAFSPAPASAHTIRIMSVHGDRLLEVPDRGRCIYLVHFTESRGMRFDRHFAVFGPNRTNPHIVFIRDGDVLATYNAGMRFCRPDRFHRAWQFTLYAS